MTLRLSTVTPLPILLLCSHQPHLRLGSNVNFFSLSMSGFLSEGPLRTAAQTRAPWRGPLLMGFCLLLLFFITPTDEFFGCSYLSWPLQWTVDSWREDCTFGHHCVSVVILLPGAEQVHNTFVKWTELPPFYFIKWILKWWNPTHTFFVVLPLPLLLPIPALFFLVPFLPSFCCHVIYMHYDNLFFPL